MDRFVVGTGRCGSTLLSSMLGECPAVCSIFEFLNGLDAAGRFAPDPIEGLEFAELISAEQPFIQTVLKRGHRVPEVVYPFERGRYRPDDVPYVLVSALPRLSTDPDGLFDEMRAFASRQPARPAAAQFRALFDWLAQRSGRQCWIERSGSSIEYLAALRERFPQARFLHIVRDGHEVALSMRNFAAYRLPVCLLYRATGEGAADAPPFDVEDLRAPARSDDVVTRLLESPPAPEVFGRYWSDQIVRGVGAARGLGPDRYREIHFEDLLARPAEVLQEVSAFLGIDPVLDDWIPRAAGLVHGAPPERFGGLDEEARERLRAACLPGRELLRESASWLRPGPGG